MRSRDETERQGKRLQETRHRQNQDRESECQIETDRGTEPRDEARLTRTHKTGKLERERKG